jgi:hypothetical protein
MSGVRRAASATPMSRHRDRVIASIGVSRSCTFPPDRPWDWIGGPIQPGDVIDHEHAVIEDLFPRTID